MTSTFGFVIYFIGIFVGVLLPYLGMRKSPCKIWRSVAGKIIEPTGGFSIAGIATFDYQRVDDDLLSIVGNII